MNIEYNGKTIYMSLEDYLALDDESWQYLRSVDAGDYIENPFSKSSTYSNTTHKVDKVFDFEIEGIEDLDDDELDEIINQLEDDLDEELDIEDFDN